jgi:hypothetical protein
MKIVAKGEQTMASYDLVDDLVQANAGEIMMSDNPIDVIEAAIQISIL